MKITIYGLPGTGTSTVGKLLAKKLDYSFTSTGNIFRSFAEGAGLSVYEFEDTVAKHDDSFDIKLDNRVKEYGKQNNDFIFESRLAWNFIPDSFKISLNCEDGERYRRIHEREGGCIEDIIKKNNKRHNETITRYNEAYPNVVFPPLDDSFDYIMDTTNIGVEEIVEILYKKISTLS